MLKTLGPKVLALDKELVPWSTQSELCCLCTLPTPVLFVVSPCPEALDTSKILSLTQPWHTALMLDLGIWLLLV